MQSFGSSKEFLIGDEMDWETVGEGVKRKIMGYDDSLMLVNVSFDTGGIGLMHQHYHAQVTYVHSGQFEVTIGEERRTLKGGDCFYIPPHKMHGAVCLEAGVLIDVFSPIREDFMGA